jgi:glutamate synthase (ferredoxin)
LQDDFETAIRNQNLNIIGWRDVPVDVSNLGQIAAENNKTSVYGKNGLELTEHQQFNAYYAARKILNILLNSKTSKVICYHLSTTTIS